MADFCLYFGTVYFKLVLILKQFCKIMPFISFQAYSKQTSCLWKTVLSNIFVYNIQARTILNKTNKHQELILRSCAVLNSLKDFHIISQFRDGCNVTLGMKTEHKHTWGLSWRVHSNCWSALKNKKKNSSYSNWNAEHASGDFKPVCERAWVPVCSRSFLPPG